MWTSLPSPRSQKQIPKTLCPQIKHLSTFGVSGWQVGAGYPISGYIPTSIPRMNGETLSLFAWGHALRHDICILCIYIYDIMICIFKTHIPVSTAMGKNIIQIDCWLKKNIRFWPAPNRVCKDFPKVNISHLSSQPPPNRSKLILGWVNFPFHSRLKNQPILSLVHLQIQKKKTSLKHHPILKSMVGQSFTFKTPQGGLPWHLQSRTGSHSGR